MTATAALTDFLLARIAEDEARARRTVWAIESGPNKSHVGDRFLLAECEAKRRIVADFLVAADVPDAYDDGYADGYRCALERACESLAAAYADHEDYRDEWRP